MVSEIHNTFMLIPLPLHQYVEEQSDYMDIEKRFEEFDNYSKSFFI